MNQDMLAIILLASGRSNRFGSEDKLLAPLNRKPLGSYAAALFAAKRTPLHCAVIPADTPQRASLYHAHGWHTLTNPSPEHGQGASLAIAAKHLQTTEASAALILLADMPFVTEAYLQALITATPDGYAAMSQSGDTLLPPALFPRSTFVTLADTMGDKGARTIYKGLTQTNNHPISLVMARDIDTPEALIRAHESSLHA